MARTVGPFLSVDASGTLAGAMTASIWKGQQYIRRWFRPTNPKTPAQETQRTLFAAAVDAWQGLYPALMETWNIAARDVYPPISGFNYFVMQFIIQPLIPGALPTIPPIAPKKKRTLHGRSVYGLDIGY